MRKTLFTLTALLLSSTASFAQMNLDCRSTDRTRMSTGCTIVLQNKASTAAEKSEALVRRSWVYYDLGQYDAALSDLKKAIELNPNSADAQAYYGRSLRQSGQAQKALVALNAALRIAPQFAFALMTRGDTLSNLGRYQDALVDFDRAITINASHAQTYALRGRAHRIAGQLDLALADLTRAITISPRYAFALAERGDVWQAKSDFARAVADYDASLAIAPNASAVTTRRSAAAALLAAEAPGVRRKETSAPAAKPAPEPRPSTQPAQGQKQPSQAAPSQPAQVDPATEQQLAQAQAALDARNFKLAHEITSAVIKANPTATKAYLIRGITLARAGVLADAEKDLSRVLELSPNNPDALFNRGLVYVDLGRGINALADGKALVLAAPNAIHGHMVSGLAHAVMKNHALAIESYSIVLSRSETTHFVRIQRGHSHLALGQLDAATRDVEDTLKMDPYNADAITLRGHLHRTAGRIAEAKADYEMVLKLQPANLAAKRALSALTVGDAIEQLPQG